MRISPIKAAKSARATRLLTLLGAFALMALAGGIALAASGGPSVPTPTITSGPSDPTSQTSASFAFRDEQSKVTFECSLDGASFAACTSPKAYAGPLAQGSHTFRVRARNAAGQFSSAAARTWTVDTQPPPAPQITQTPPSLSASRAATFAFTDAEGGVKFLCKLDGGSFASCSSPKSYSGLSQGAHTFSVEARDAAGNTGSATSFSWTVDTQPPPRPKIIQHPTDPSGSSSATFAFTDQEAGAHFECRLDGADWSPCTSPVTYDGLAAARHQFRVRALDAAGNRSDDVEFDWKVTQQSGQPFTIAGSFSGLLVPGRSGSLALTVTNPNSVPIVVTSLVVTVQPGSTKPGCDGPANLQVTQSSAAAANPLTVPAGGHVTLPSGSVSAPQILMRNLPTNQDACKGATFAFGYSGSAHS